MPKRVYSQGRTTVELSPELRKVLDNYCRTEERTLTWAVSKAVREFLDRYYGRTKESKDASR